MACVSYGNLTISRSDNQYRRHILRCPVCECSREFVVSYPDSLWYSPTAMCCGCGDAWSDGERAERPFARGWRAKAVAEHRRLYDIATHGLAPLVRDLFEPAVTA